MKALSRPRRPPSWRERDADAGRRPRVCYDPAPMNPGQTPVPLLLQGVPDGRRAPWPVLPPVSLPYAALLLGSGVAAALALYNAVCLRRARLASIALAAGIAGWLGFGVLVTATFAGGSRELALALLPARLWNVALGALLAWSQWSHVRGHAFLGGRAVALLHVVVVAFLVFFALPARPLLVLQGLWGLLLR